MRQVTCHECGTTQEVLRRLLDQTQQLNAVKAELAAERRR